jgi:hypothetical protein
VSLAGTGHILGGGIALRGSGIGGNDLTGQVATVEQLAELGDLGGVLGNRDLGDDHLLTVQQRGEQPYIHPAGGGAVAHSLAIDGQPVQPVHSFRKLRIVLIGAGGRDGGPGGGHTVGQPRPHQRIGMYGVDTLHHPADRGPAGAPRADRCVGRCGHRPTSTTARAGPRPGPRHPGSCGPGQRRQHRDPPATRSRCSTWHWGGGRRTP